MGMCSWESPFTNHLAGAPGGDYLSRPIVNCRGEHPLRTLRSWGSPPADGSRSPERSQAGDALRNRHHAVAVPPSGPRARFDRLRPRTGMVLGLSRSTIGRWQVGTVLRCRRLVNVRAAVDVVGRSADVAGLLPAEVGDQVGHV